MSGTDFRAVFCLRSVELSQSPIYDLESSLIQVHDSVRHLNVPMHDTMRMTRIECQQKLVEVELNVLQIQFECNFIEGRAI